LIPFESLFPPCQLFNTHNTVEDEDGVRVFNINRGVSLTHHHHRSPIEAIFQGFIQEEETNLNLGEHKGFECGI
jgi:hypothetical protein